MRFGTNPVAMTSSSYSTTLPSARVTVLAALSTDAAAEPSISVMLFSS